MTTAPLDSYTCFEDKKTHDQRAQKNKTGLNKVNMSIMPLEDLSLLMVNKVLYLPTTSFKKGHKKSSSMSLPIVAGQSGASMRPTSSFLALHSRGTATTDATSPLGTR